MTTRESTKKKLQVDVRQRVRELEERALKAIADRLEKYNADDLISDDKLQKMLFAGLGIETSYDWRITDRSPLRNSLQEQVRKLAAEVTERLSNRTMHEEIAKTLMRRPKFIASAQKIYVDALEAALLAEVERRAKEQIRSEVDTLVEGVSGMKVTTGGWSDNSDLTFDLQAIFAAALVGERAEVEGYIWVDIGDTIRTNDILYDQTIVDVSRMLRAGTAGISGNKVTTERSWLRAAK